MNQTVDPSRLLGLATADREAHLGPLLEVYRNYLRVLAEVEIGRQLQAKVDASDLVQETMMEAHKHFVGFRGDSEAEFLAWLRQIMAGVLCGLIRRYLGTQKRDIRLERNLCDGLDQSSRMLVEGFVDRQGTPSQQAARREESVLLADALAKLPEDYRQVLFLRHLQGLSFPEIGRKLGRSQDSVEKLWVRGLARLRHVMETLP